MDARSGRIIGRLSLGYVHCFGQMVSINGGVPISGIMGLSDAFKASSRAGRFMAECVHLARYSVFFSSTIVFIRNPTRGVLIPDFLTGTKLSSCCVSIVRMGNHRTRDFHGLVRGVKVTALVIASVSTASAGVRSKGRGRPSIVATGKGSCGANGPSVGD